MITVRIIRNASNEKIGFRSAGHAEFDDPGRDIICAAVSVLELNLANSVLKRFGAGTMHETLPLSDKDGSFSFILSSRENRNAALLLDSCLLGLEAVSREYGSNYLTISDQEV